MVRISAALAMALALSGCGGSDDPDRRTGETCTLTSECDAPLVCRLGRCRVECREARDCGAGQVCLVDEDGNGSCRVAEDGCTLDSDCPEPLVCRGAACANACEEDRDCPTGQQCIESACRLPMTDGG